LEYARKAADKDNNATDVLDNNGGVGNELPEFVGLEPGIALKVVEEGVFVRVVVGIYGERGRISFLIFLQV
jgi:hypothetical protein